MANLGTLWFGADVDLTALKKSIQEGNKDILNALKMDYDPQSFNKMVEKLQSELNNKTFNIQLSADGKALTQAVGNIEKVVGSLGQAGKGGTIAPFDTKNIEAAAQGIAGMKGNVIDLSKQILDQKDKVHEWQNVVSKLREEWGKAVASGGRKSDSANAAYELYSGAREVLKQEREELFKLTQQRGKATVALREMLLSEQLSQTESTTARQKYNAMLVETEKLLVRINDAIRNGGKTPLLDIAARDLSAFQTRAVLVDTKDVTAMSNLVSEFNRLSKVYGQVTTEAEKADKAYMKTVNDFTEQSKKAYAEREKAAAKASQTEKKSASDASAEWTRLEAIIARLNVLRDNALKAKVPTDGVDGLINKMKQLQSLYSEISLNNGRLSNGMLFKDLKGSANTKSAMHEISQVYTETNQKIRESNQLTRESEREAKAKAAAVSAAEKQIQREIDRSKKLYDDLTASIGRGKKASRDMSALESQQSRLNGQMMLLKNMTAADKENASLVEKRVKGIQDVRTETERLKKAEDELTRARERANKRNDNAALKNLKDEEKSVRDAWNRYEELKLKIREVEALKQRGVALKMDVSEIDSALVRLKDLRWQMSDIINNGGRRSTGKNLLTSELWSDSGKRELLNANAEIKNFTANLRETEKESRQADAGIKRLGMAFNELKGYIKQNGGSDEMRRLQSELQGAIQKMRQLMNAGDYKGAASVFERVSGNIRQAQVATRQYESSLRGASSGVSQLTEQERQLALSLKGSSDAMKGQSQLLGDLKAMATQYLGVWGAQAFVRNIIEIGGQLEMQRLSIGAILGDMAKADDLFGKIKNLAVKSPFGVVELDQMTKQLSAYGFEYNELFDMTKRLADISAATGTSVDRLALALGHVRSEAALSGYTLRQFSMANIPLAKKLSEHLSEVEGKLVSIADVRKRVRNKEIGYQEVLDVLKELTDEGGMFYNAQEIMSESVKAKFKNLKDSMDIMYGELAESAVGGVLKDVAAMLTTLTRHWEELGGVLLAVAGYWTIHKVSMVALSRATIEGNIAMGKFTAAQLEAQAVTGNLTRQQLLRAVASGKMAVADAQAAASVLGLTTAQLQLVRRTGDVSRAMTMATLSTSKYSITQLRLIASMRSVNLGWLAQGMIGIANGAKAAAVAVKGLLASMWPMLALSAIAEVFFSIKREQEEFAESANYVGQSARQMMKDLDDAYNSVTKNGKPMDTEALREAVKTMRDVLEQNEFYTKEQQAQVANAQTLSQKYDVLLQQMKDMREEAMFLANSEDLFKKIIENTGRHVVTNDSETYNPETGKYEHRKHLGSRFFNDSLTENMDEVNKANSQLESSIQMLAEYQGVMEEAIKKNNNFGLSLDGKSWQEQIRLIAESGHWDEFVASVEGAGNRFEKTAANVKKASDDVRDKWDEVVNDDFEAIKLTIMEQLNLTEDQFNDWAKNNETALRWFADGIVRMVSKLGISQTLLDELKERFLNFFNFASKGKPTAVQPTQYDLQSDLAKQIVGNIVRSNAKNGKLVYGEKLIKEVNDLVGTGEHVKTVSEAVKAIKDRAQKDHDAMKDVEKIYGQTSKEYAAAKKKYEHSLEIAESNGISRSEIEKDKSKNTSEKEENQAEKEAKAREKQFEERLKEAERQAKELRELEDVMAELGVASIADRGERERAQEDLEFEKRKKQIAREAEEMRKANYEAAKKAWEADAALAKQRNGGKGTAAVWADTEMAQQVLKDGGYGSVALTDAQWKKIEAEEKKVLIERERRIRESNEALVKEHQSYTDRKIEIDKEYKEAVAEIEKAIADLRVKMGGASTDEEKEKIQAQIDALYRSLGEVSKKRIKSLSEVAKNELQESPLFSLAWKDLGAVSTETLNMLIAKFKEVAQQFADDPQQYKEWMERIQAMSDEVAMRNPYKAIFEARQEIEGAIQRKSNLTEEMNRLDAEIKDLEHEKTGSGTFWTSKQEKELTDKREQLKKVTDDIGQAEQDLADATTKQNKAWEESKRQVDELANAISTLGDTIGGTAGKILSLIGDVMTFATSTADGIKKVSETTSTSMSVIEKASVILTIISAALQLAQKISDLLPDSTKQYEKYRDKVNEVNKMEQAVRDYERAVLEAKNAEDSWFGTSKMRDLSNQWKVSGKARDDYFEKLHEQQATYENESGSGWLTKLGAQANKTIASIGNSINKALGIDGAFGDAMIEMAQFGWANVAGGPVGAGMYAENKIWNKGWDVNYVKGLTEAWKNLRIETRKASKGFLGTGVGGHSQRTEDLVTWVKRELGFDLFDKEGWLNDEAYESIMKNYEDKLVGETKETLEALKELKEKHDEFLEQLHDYVNEMYAPIMQNFTDAMWAWFDDGKDALTAFREAAGDTFRNIVSDLLQTQMLKLFGDKMSETITKLYEDYFDKGTISYNELMNGVTSAVNEASVSFQHAQPVLQQTITMVEQALDSYGMSMKESSQYFDDLSSSFKDMLSDMTDDLDDFAKNIKKKIYEAMLDIFVYNSPFETIVDGEKKTFDSFYAYLEDWKQRTTAVIKGTDKTWSEMLSAEEAAKRIEYNKGIIALLQNEIANTTDEEKIRQLTETIAELQSLIDELERGQGVDFDARQKERLEEYNDELQRSYELLKNVTKTYAELSGWGIEVQIDASPFANLADDILSFANDSTKTIEDWKKDIVKMMTEDLVKELVLTDDFKNRVRDLQEMYVYAMTGDIENIAKLKDKYPELFDGDLFKFDLSTDEGKAAFFQWIADQITGLATTAKETSDEINEAMDNIGVETAFGDLRDKFKSTLTDMEADAESFRKDITKTLVEDLIEKSVLDVPLTVNIEGEDTTFDNFDKYGENWNARYAARIQDYNAAVKELNAAQAALQAATEAGNQQAIDMATQDLQKAQEHVDSIRDAIDALIDELVSVNAMTLEQAKQLRESLKIVEEDTTFTGLESSFVSALMDMEGDVKDFANDIKKTIVQKLVEAFLVSEKIKPLLDDLQKTFNHAMGLTFEGMTTEDATKERAKVIANGYTDENGERHQGVDDITGVLEPVKLVVNELLTAMGYVAKEGETLFSNLGDTILESLLDVSSGVEGFMDSITQTITEDLVKSYMATDEFQEGLKTVKDDLEAAVKALAEAKTPEEIAAAEEQLKNAKKAAEDFYNEAVDGTKRFTDALKKIENNTTFKDMTGNWMSNLMDFNATAEDWAEEIGQTMAQKIIEQMIVPTMIQPLLDNIQKAFNDAMAANTTSDAEGNAVYNWKGVLNDEGLKASITALQDAYPDLKDVVQQILSLSGVKPDFSNALDDLGDTLLDRLLSLDSDVEDIGRQIGQTLIREMLQQMLKTGPYADEIAAIRQMWQDILSGEDTAHTWEDVVARIEALEGSMSADGLDGLITKYKELDKEADTTFSGMADSWVSSLIDMNTTAEYWAQDVGRMMAEKIIKEMVVPTLLQPLLNDLQTAMDTAISAEGSTWQSVLAAVLPFISQITDKYGELQPIVEQIMNSFGIFRDEEDEFEYALQDLRSEFVSALMNMESDAEDFSKSIGKILSQTFIDKYILGEAFDQQMEAWQQQYENIMNSGMSEDERRRQVKQLRDAIAYAKEGYVEEARAIQELLGLNAKDDQNATANMADKITYDQADQLLGINMAQEMTLEQILATIRGGLMLGGGTTAAYGTVNGQNALNQQILSALQGMQNATSVTGTGSDIFNRLGYTNEYLRAIRDSNETMLAQFGNVLGQINSKLARL